MSVITKQKSDHFHVGHDEMIVDPTVQLSRAGSSDRAAEATIVIGAGGLGANQRTITIQLFKEGGLVECDSVQQFFLVVFVNDTKTAFAVTGGSTGVAIGTDGALLALVAKKVFLCTSEVDGDWDGTWTDTQTESACIAVILPNGNIVCSADFANT